MSEATDTRQRIIDAAGPIFADVGFERATVRDISQAAQVNLAAINYHFGDKKKLYVDTLLHARDFRSQSGPNLFAGLDDAEPEQALHSFIQTLLQRLLGEESDVWQARLIVREILEPTDAGQFVIVDYFRPTFENLVETCNRITGRILPLSVLEKCALSVIGQCFHYRAAGRSIRLTLEHRILGCEEYGIEELANHIFTFSVGGIRAVATFRPKTVGIETS